MYGVTTRRRLRNASGPFVPNNWAAYVPDLPGCVTTGRTIEETRRLIAEAVEFHIEGMRLRGKMGPGKWGKRVSAAMLEFNKQVNASIVDPGFIARVRKKLALDQRQAAAIFGGGANAFSRYENGKTKPPLALVKLLMVLDRHPNLLNEVRAGR